MALRCDYESTRSPVSSHWYYDDTSTGEPIINLSSQVSLGHYSGSNHFMPVAVATTSQTLVAYGHHVLSTQIAANIYDIEAPTSPYGQVVSFKCIDASSTGACDVRVSTDASVTYDGTNNVLAFTSSNQTVQMVSRSSQIWDVIYASGGTYSTQTS